MTGGQIVFNVAMSLVYVALLFGSLAGQVKGSRLRKYPPITTSAFVVVALVPVFVLIYSYFTSPHSPFAQARPYLTFAVIVSLAALVGKFTLSTAIVPFLKAIPGAVAGIVVKVGWDKWQARKPREPKPQS